MADFADRIRELAEMVGDGPLDGTVEVDQVYAQYQHEDLTLNHPRGGEARYLANPMYDGYRGYLQQIAGALLVEGPAGQMADAMEHLSDQVEEHAPVEFSNLRQSGHPTVTSNGEVVYDRPPIQRRLTEEELKEQKKTGIRHRHLHPDQYP
jgi:hypothetical protein